ncbi:MULTISPECIES: YqiA/YcfP family alpha/beta fold hydrolase [Alteromonas]|uniref:Esterase YqiA n=1 Tax=Alteromonas stellipolaris TaxID=233316 RepID=A0AAW7Z217_9ALTE|nr:MULTISPECIES: YqiA/YcfP family alpha/beta fold hydrolase [Alteromonas]AMJ89584.1 esterase YqiA [Alteromonas sp. Mac2]ALM91879.1 esterase [Alteromonas stellipolaris LMG 21856]AMJ73282.1 esterase YqiA [Alteromonas stellipolaris]AMJ85724.1 esterase YqiA [Alteromonas sp. Mac1]ANB20055.1 esterase YqiA [Alteromonas stellipolaris]
MKHVLYLHGFLSSPMSVKAQATKAYFEQHHPDVTLHIPALSNYPSQVESQLLTLIESTPALIKDGLRVIGSSMGGYLSTFLIEKFSGKAVLINPAVKPYELLQGFIGKHTNPYTGEVFHIVESDIEVIEKLDAKELQHAPAYKVLLQTEDETLDYRLAETKYAMSTLVVEEGGDHSFTGFENHLPAIADFLLKD